MSIPQTEVPVNDQIPTTTAAVSSGPTIGYKSSEGSVEVLPG